MMKKILILIIFIFILMGCALQTQPFVNNKSSDQENKISNPAVENKENTNVLVPILIYHQIRSISKNDSANDQTFIVTPANFEKQLQYLKDNGWQTISFNNLVSYFSGEFNMPEKPVIISFDDGAINQYTNALPLLKKYDVTATFFIFTSPIGRSENYITWEQVKELSDSGMEIGSHGTYHLFLTKISPADLSKEIIVSKEKIEERINKEVNIFSHPFGLYNTTTLQQIKGSGYRAARDIINGARHSKDDLFRLRAYFITENFSRFVSIVNQ